MEAHDGLSAKIVEEAGFDGIWASGLTMSAALGVRDSNEASWTQILDVLEFMADATSIPILVDGDTGYGNFNNMRRVVRKLGERGRARSTDNEVGLTHQLDHFLKERLNTRLQSSQFVRVPHLRAVSFAGLMGHDQRPSS